MSSEKTPELDWKESIKAGIEIGSWRHVLPEFKEKMHIHPDWEIATISVKNTHTDEICLFEFDASLSGHEDFYFPKLLDENLNWLLSEENGK